MGPALDRDARQPRGNVESGFANEVQFQSTKIARPSRKQRLSERTSRWQSALPATVGIRSTQDHVEVPLQPSSSRRPSERNGAGSSATTRQRPKRSASDSVTGFVFGGGFAAPSSVSAVRTASIRVSSQVGTQSAALRVSSAADWVPDWNEVRINAVRAALDELAAADPRHQPGDGIPCRSLWTLADRCGRSVAVPLARPARRRLARPQPRHIILRAADAAPVAGARSATSTFAPTTSAFAPGAPSWSTGTGRRSRIRTSILPRGFRA